jgi:hypothetical protein
MHSDGIAFYPTRSLIRFQAKKYLIADLHSGGSFIVVAQVGESNRTTIIDAQPTDPSDRIPNESQPLSQQDSEPSKLVPSMDDELFAEISSTAFHPERHPELYQPHASEESATDVERAIATEIVDTYKRILKNRSDRFIQDLNSLL